MTIEGYKELVEKGLDAASMGDLIDMMPKDAIVALRVQCEALGLPVIRPMYYDYDSQLFF